MVWWMPISGLCLIFLTNIPGATFIPGATSIPESRVMDLDSFYAVDAIWTSTNLDEYLLFNSFIFRNKYAEFLFF